MPFTSGTYSLPTGNPVVPGTTISSTTTNTTNSDIATALSACLLKDGTQTVTANIPMASHKFTGLSAGTTAGDSVEFAGSPSFTNLAYTGTLTGSTGILNIGSGQVYKDASGNVGIGTSSPSAKLTILASTNNGISVNDGTVTTILYNTSSVQGSVGTTSNHPMTFFSNNTERMRIDSSGNLLVGTTSNGASNSASTIMFPSATFIQHISGAASGSTYMAYNYNGAGIGSITQNGTTGVLYNLTSDYRLKNNPTALTGASEFIKALQPKTWDWWDGSGKGVGFIAHEFMEVAKYSGNGTKDEVDAEGKPVMQAIQPSSSEVMANLVSFVQELKAIIEALTSRLTALEAK